MVNMILAGAIGVIALAIIIILVIVIKLAIKALEMLKDTGKHQFSTVGLFKYRLWKRIQGFIFGILVGGGATLYILWIAERLIMEGLLP